MSQNNKKYRCRCIICGRWFASGQPNDLYDNQVCSQMKKRKQGDSVPGDYAAAETCLPTKSEAF